MQKERKIIFGGTMVGVQEFLVFLFLLFLIFEFLFYIENDLKKESTFFDCFLVSLNWALRKLVILND